MEKLPEYGATIGDRRGSGVKNVKTWQRGGLAAPAFSLLCDGKGGRWDPVGEFSKMGRVEFKCGLVNDLTLPTLTQGQVVCEWGVVGFLGELTAVSFLFLFFF